MEGGKYAYLVCVDGQSNHNKYYEMKQISTYEFIAAYGREGKTRTEKIYQMYDWDRVYRKRVHKSRGKEYTDMTHLRQVEVVEDISVGQDSSISAITDSAIRTLIAKLQQYAHGSVSVNYKVSSQEVSEAMILEANDILATISGLIYTPDIHGVTNRDINDLLERLYLAVPRAMNKVQDHMLPFTSGLDLEYAKQLYNQEQANIDVMESQVSVAPAIKDVKDDVEKGESILDRMNVSIRVANQAEASRAKRMASEDGRRIGRVYVVENKVTQVEFDKRMIIQNDRGAPHNKVETYWHGTRNENVMSILKKGLLVRPPRAVTTGAMFGVGIYFADKFQKAFGYTSHRGSYWAQGNSDTGFMGLFEVNIGKQYEVGRWRNNHYDLSADGLERLGGYDSTWGQSGGSLRNNEFIIYRPDQCTVSYLVQLV